MLIFVLVLLFLQVHKFYEILKGYLSYAYFCIKGVPTTTPSFTNSLGSFTGVSIQSYLCLIFIKSKRIQTKSAKGKNMCGKVQGKPGTNFYESFLNEVIRSLIPPASNCDHTCAGGLPGKLMRDSVAKNCIEGQNRCGSMVEPRSAE